MDAILVALVAFPIVALVLGVTWAGTQAGARQTYADPNCPACGGLGEILDPCSTFGLLPCDCFEDAPVR